MSLPTPSQSVDGRTASRWLLRFAAPVRLQLGAAVLAGLVVTGGTVGQAWALAMLAQRVIAERAPLGGEVRGLLLLVGAAALRALGSYLQDRLSARAAASAQADVRTALLGHLLDSGGAAPTAAPSAGGFAYTFLEQVDRLEPFYARFLPRAALAVVAPLLLLAVIFPVNAVVGVLLLLSLPLIPVGMAVVGLGAENVSREQLQTVQRLSAVFLDRLQGLPTLRRLGAAQAQLRDIERASTALADRTMAVLRIALLSSAALEFFSTFAVAMVATYVGLSLLRFVSFGSPAGGMTLFQGLFVLLLSPACFAPMRALAAAYHDRADALAAAEPLIAATPGRSAEPPAPASPIRATFGCREPSSAPTITLSGIEVTYPNRREAALCGLDLTIHAGEILVITGPSGAGKSTLLSVLAGQLIPVYGEIAVNGQVSDAARWLRAHTGWVGQRPYLFPGTLAENIALGQPTATPDEIQSAAQQAQVMAFAARLPGGLSAEIGERGAGLSGGQRQRVGLARAFLHAAPLLLLDEPTAHLDAVTEAELLGTIAELARGRSVVIATHSPAALGLGDRVLCLEGGSLGLPGTQAQDTAVVYG